MTFENSYPPSTHIEMSASEERRFRGKYDVRTGECAGTMELVVAMSVQVPRTDWSDATRTRVMLLRLRPAGDLMKKQALSFDDVKRTISALEVYASALEEEIISQDCEPSVIEEAEATRVLITKYSALYESSGESTTVH
jgi:hypothetical protein